MPLPAFFTFSATVRWSTSVTWVTAPGRISFASSTDAACAVLKIAVEPRSTVFGPPASFGRASLKRYGGV